MEFLERSGYPDLAYHYTPAGESGKDLPLVMFCGGYRSDMNGTKATYLEAQCKARSQAYLRFDYSGHGNSGGTFEEGTIGAWAADAIAVFDMASAQHNKILLVGSSMGGWIAFLIAKARTEHVAGLVGIAAAPDFVDDMFERRLNPVQQKTLLETGMVEIPNDYSDEPYHFTRSFYEDGKVQRVLDKGLVFDFPICLVQGKLDVDVPWEAAEAIKSSVRADGFDIHYIEDGDHRLSRPEDLILIDQKIMKLSGL